jgi:membrane fusion protein (multidrug efflux system)
MYQNKITIFSFLPTTAYVFLLFILITGCHFELPPQPTPHVTVEEPVIQDVPKRFYMSGQTVASKSVDIPARVTGVLEKMFYKKGDYVPAGKQLFLIEQTQYTIAVKSAQAKLLSTKSKAEDAESILKRQQLLQKQNATTAQDLQTFGAQRDQMVAALQEAQATLEQTELNLKYTEISSPISGKTNISEVAVGNLVGPGTNYATLVTVVSVDPMGVEFTITDKEFFRLADEYRKKREELLKQEPTQIIADNPEDDAMQTFDLGFFTSVLPENAEYPFQGKIKAFDNTINQATGTIKVYGEVPNSGLVMLPGTICRIRITERIQKEAVTIHQESICFDLNQQYVFVIDEKNIARRRNIELGDKLPNQTQIVLKGLEKNDKVVFRGVQNVRNGELVVVSK